MVGKSEPMQAVLATIRLIGPRESNILIEGESGTGKELVARAIHAASLRRQRGFVAVDCGSLSDTLLESELFGHRKGSFTGATGDRVGLLEEADGGTLFLDELANASPAFQARLLRVLQEGEVRRIGENRTRQIYLRVIGATSTNLQTLVSAGRFREDLYYRLNVISLNLPPVRKRQEDVPALLDYFLAHCCSRYDLPSKRFTQAALEILLRYRWPGNVREVENVVERAVLMAPSESIGPDSLPPQFLDALLQFEDKDTAAGPVKTGEQQMIERALLESNGNKSRAARLIGWHRTKLYRRLKSYRIPNDLGCDRDRSTPSVRPHPADHKDLRPGRFNFPA